MRNKKWIIGAVVAIILVLAIAGSAYAVVGPHSQASQTNNTGCLGPAACPAADGAGVCPVSGDSSACRYAGDRSVCPQAAAQNACPRAAGSCCGD